MKMKRFSNYRILVESDASVEDAIKDFEKGGEKYGSGDD